MCSQTKAKPSTATQKENPKTIHAHTFGCFELVSIFRCLFCFDRLRSISLFLPLSLYLSHIFTVQCFFLVLLFFFFFFFLLKDETMNRCLYVLVDRWRATAQPRTHTHTNTCILTHWSVDCTLSGISVIFVAFSSSSSFIFFFIFLFF